MVSRVAAPCMMLPRSVCQTGSRLFMSEGRVPAGSGHAPMALAHAVGHALFHLLVLHFQVWEAMTLLSMVPLLAIAGGSLATSCSWSWPGWSTTCWSCGCWQHCCGRWRVTAERTLPVDPNVDVGLMRECVPQVATVLSMVGWG